MKPEPPLVRLIFSLSTDFEEHETLNIQRSNKNIMINPKNKTRTKEHRRSNFYLSDVNPETSKLIKVNNMEKQSASNNNQYVKRYKGDIKYSTEDHGRDIGGKMKEMKVSNQLREFSDYSGKDEDDDDKPAINTLKKTFSSMLSKMPGFARQSEDSSSTSDNCSVMSKSSKAWDASSTLGKSLYRKPKESSALSRANSTASVNIKSSGSFSCVCNTTVKLFI